jgi:hypothetical protein
MKAKDGFWKTPAMKFRAIKKRKRKTRPDPSIIYWR